MRPGASASEASALVDALGTFEPRALPPLLEVLERLTTHGLAAPILQGAARELWRQASAADSSFSDLSAIVLTDGNISARLVMSAGTEAELARGRRAAVDSALVRVGFEGARLAALDTAIASRVSSGKYRHALARVLDHARTISALARAMAPAAGADPGRSALLGLLHATGAVVIVDGLRALRVRPSISTGALLRAIDVVHPPVCAVAALALGLDADLAGALAQHHDDSGRRTASERTLALADQLAPRLVTPGSVFRALLTDPTSP